MTSRVKLACGTLTRRPPRTSTIARVVIVTMRALPRCLEIGIVRNIRISSLSAGGDRHGGRENDGLGLAALRRGQLSPRELQDEGEGDRSRRVQEADRLRRAGRRR